MKKYYLLLLLLNVIFSTQAQLYVAPGDSIAVLPGTLFTLQEDLVNNGKIYNSGVLTLNGTAVQNLSGAGLVDNITADNNAVLQDDITVNNSLLVNAGKIFDIGNSQLTNNGNINGTGFLKGSLNAQLVLNGSGSSVIQFDQSSDALSNALKNITASGSGANISFQNKLYVYEALLPDAGNILLNDELVLRSSSGGTARVGAVGSNFSYGSNGKFVIERYIPGNRAWRLLTAPVTTASQVKISEAWQDNAPRVTNVNDINSTNNPNPGYGTHVTFGMPAGNGYDQGINGNTSIRYLMNTGWNGVPTATNDGSMTNSGYINDQPGYMLFVRGDRSTLLWQATGAVTSPTVLRPKGKINTGDINHPLTASFDNGLGSTFRVIGNPYPSPINFHSIASNPVNAVNGFADAFYLWDPNITGNNGVGGFVGMSYNAAASFAAGKPVYDRTVLTGGSSSIDNSGDIQSGAAFVVNYTGAGTSLQIREGDKSKGSSNTFFRPARQIRTSLLAVNNDNTVSVNDGVLSTFAEVNNDAVDNNDLRKLNNFAENIAIRREGKQLSIERRDPLQIRDTIFYHISKMKQKNYILELAFDRNVIPAGSGAFLEDLFLQRKKPVNSGEAFRYPFSVTANAASADSNRFRLVFKPVRRLISIRARLTNEDVQINWEDRDTLAPVQYEIERSTDSILFVNYSITTSSMEEWRDIKPLPGTYFYRIKTINKQGVISYSEVVKVEVENHQHNMFVFPNPVTNNNINLRLKNEGAGLYHVQLRDNAGKLVEVTSFNHTGGSAIKNISLRNKLSNGIYQMEITSPEKKNTLLNVFVQNR